MNNSSIHLHILLQYMLSNTCIMLWKKATKENKKLKPE